MSASGADAYLGLNPTLVAGYETVSRDQEVVFTEYVKYVLPLDGYVFWLKTRQTPITGSLHVASNSIQNEDDSPTINQVVFTTTTETTPLNDIGPNTILVGTWRGIKFAFSRRAYYFDNAGIYHYAGDAVYPVMESQLVDVGSELPADTLVVSNSLPAWLTVRSYSPVWLVPKNPAVVLYPSFAVPDNLPPPYGSVHIEPSQTSAWQGAPVIDRVGSHFQLATDHVRVTLYGLTNDKAQDWLDTLYQYSYDWNVIGIGSMQVLRDEKRTQNELNILAMKKTVEFNVSYNQSRVRDVARQLILSATASFHEVPVTVFA